MNITFDDYAAFAPKGFEIYTFYGETTCFCWNRQELVVFSYPKRSTAPLKKYIAPDNIRQVQCYLERIFIICSPRGVYKLSRDGEFAVLSKNAIGISTLFYEVFTPRSGYLYLDNKKDETNKQLLCFPSCNSGPNELAVFILNAKCSDKEFLETVSSRQYFNEDVCFFGHKKKLYKLIKGTVHLLHQHTNPISQIVPVIKESKIKGLILVLDHQDSVVISYAVAGKLRFQTVCLGTKVEAICAGFSLQIPNTLWIVYSDGNGLFYARKQLLMGSFYKIRAQIEGYDCLKCYNSMTIIALTGTGQVIELSTEEVEKTLSSKSNTSIDLEMKMLQTTNTILNAIFNKVQLLDKANQDLLAAQEILKRISLYAQKRKIRTCPDISLGCVCKDLFVAARFTDAFPPNSLIVLTLCSRYSTTFCSKKVTSSDMTVELQVPRDTTAKDLKISIDLVTLPCAEKPWCLMRNCIKETMEEKRRTKLKPDKQNFLQAKLAVLRKLAETRPVDMRKLAEIKRSVRKELGDT